MKVLSRQAAAFVRHFEQMLRESSTMYKEGVHGVSWAVLGTCLC